MTNAPEVASIAITTSALTPAHGSGRLRYVASVLIDTGLIELALFNVQVVADDQGRLFVKMPQTRDPATGRWQPAVQLPEQIETALAVMLLEMVPGASVRTVARPGE